MGSKDSSGGNTPVTNFRLSPEALARLDELVAAFSEENSDQETRTSVVRKLINREWERRKKPKGKK